MYNIRRSKKIFLSFVALVGSLFADGEISDDALLAGSYEDSPYDIAVRKAQGLPLESNKKARVLYPELVPDSTTPQLNEPVGVYITAGGLIGTTGPGALSAGLSGVPSLPATPGTQVKGSVFHPKVPIGAGLILGFGILTNRDDWEFLGEYTYFQGNTNTRSHVEDPASATILPGLFDPLATTTTFYFADYNWSLILNSMNLSLKRGFYIGNQATLDTSIGVKGGWTNQEFNLKFTQTASPPNTNFELSQYFSGIGPRFALQSELFFVRQVGAFINTATSLLWSRTLVKETMLVATNDGGPLSYKYLTQNRYYTVRPTFELSLGAIAHLYNKKKTQHLELRAGWEADLWMDHIAFFNLGYTNQNAYNLFVQAFLFRLRIDF